jgi:hypothetical protein
VELVINATVTVLYPIASALINLTSVACVIHATQQDGVHNWTDYRVLLLSEFLGRPRAFIHLRWIGDFVYGGRSVLYALLAATDPVSPTVRNMRRLLM